MDYELWITFIEGSAFFRSPAGTRHRYLDDDGAYSYTCKAGRKEGSVE
jgi:hypothetical protein